MLCRSWREPAPVQHKAFFMLPFVSVALKASESMQVADQQTRSIIMMFAKKYSPEKMGKIVYTAKKFPWWQMNPKAAFMKAVGVVNKEEKEALSAET